MGYDQYAVIKVRGSDPEVFWVVWMDSTLPKGGYMKSSQNLAESGVREELAKMGISKTDADALIQRARDNPK
jgi:hypothetical protein